MCFLTSSLKQETLGLEQDLGDREAPQGPEAGVTPVRASNPPS